MYTVRPLCRGIWNWRLWESCRKCWAFEAAVRVGCCMVLNNYDRKKNGDRRLQHVGRNAFRPSPQKFTSSGPTPNPPPLADPSSVIHPSRCLGARRSSVLIVSGSDQDEFGDLRSCVDDGLLTSLMHKFDQRTPIIAIPSNSKRIEIMTCHNHGMNDVLPNPCTKEELLGILEEYLMHLKVTQRMSHIPAPMTGLSDSSSYQVLTGCVMNLGLGESGEGQINPLPSG